MKSEIVFAVYKPHDGKKAELEKLAKTHLPTLKRLGLVTDRPGVLALSTDGSIIEVFEWKSKEAIGLAHEHPEVANVWEAMGKVCSFGTLSELPEGKDPFAHFT